MSLWRQLTRGGRALARPQVADREIADEVRHFIDEATAAFVADGLSPDDARRAARRLVGNPAAIEDQIRDYGWENALGTLVADLRFAARMLGRSPVFTVVALLVIALGSGAVTTIFSAMNALVLRPLPAVGRPDRLVGIEPTRPDGEVLQQGSYSQYEYLRDRAHALEAIGAWGKVSLTIAARNEGAALWGNLVSGNFFDVLDLHPAHGRFFSSEETRTPLAHPVIVVSHSFWKSHLAADPSSIGRMVLVNGSPFTLIGVAPENFRGIYTGIAADAWVPLAMQPLLRPRADLTNSSWLWLFGRLRDGSTRAGAQQELAALATARAIEVGEIRGRTGFSSVRVGALTGLPGGEATMLVGFLSLLLGAATLVLLIAGVNVAAMLSARSVVRRREFAVRAALGAGRARLVRQLLTEILLLFVLGALGGLFVTVLATSALEQIPLPANVPLVLELSPDLRVLGFALVVSLAAGLGFGLTPALQAARQDITSRLRDDAPGTGSKRTVFSRALIVGQLALSLVLLVAAGLFMRALARGQQINPGFNVAEVTTAPFETESLGYNEARSREFFRALRTRVDAIPGVASVSFTGRLPLTAGSSMEDIVINGTPVSVHNSKVDADYFRVLDIPILQGRAFNSGDSRRAAPVAVINESFARRFWPDGSAVGRSFRLLARPVTIIGIARDAKYATLGESTPLFAYLPLAQAWQPSQALLVRSAGKNERLGAAIQQAALSIDPMMPRPRVTSLREATSIVLLPQRVAAIVTGVLGGIGLILAAVGLYGVMAYTASSRTREIGIRIALGARRSDVLGMMVRDGMGLTSVGIAAGLLLAALVTPLAKNFLFTVSSFDAGTFAAMSLLFAVVALAASYIPARRAAGSDPLAALRTD